MLEELLNDLAKCKTAKDVHVVVDDAYTFLDDYEFYRLVIHAIDHLDELLKERAES